MSRNRTNAGQNDSTLTATDNGNVATMEQVVESTPTDTSVALTEEQVKAAAKEEQAAAQRIRDKAARDAVIAIADAFGMESGGIKVGDLARKIITDVAKNANKAEAGTLRKMPKNEVDTFKAATFCQGVVIRQTATHVGNVLEEIATILRNVAAVLPNTVNNKPISARMTYADAAAGLIGITASKSEIDILTTSAVRSLKAERDNEQRETAAKAKAEADAKAATEAATK